MFREIGLGLAQRFVCLRGLRACGVQGCEQRRRALLHPRGAQGFCPGVDVDRRSADQDGHEVSDVVRGMDVVQSRISTPQICGAPMGRRMGTRVR